MSVGDREARIRRLERLASAADRRARAIEDALSLAGPMIRNVARVIESGTPPALPDPEPPGPTPSDTCCPSPHPDELTLSTPQGAATLTKTSDAGGGTWRGCLTTSGNVTCCRYNGSTFVSDSLPVVIFFELDCNASPFADLWRLRVRAMACFFSGSYRPLYSDAGGVVDCSRIETALGVPGTTLAADLYCGPRYGEFTYTHGGNAQDTTNFAFANGNQFTLSE